MWTSEGEDDPIVVVAPNTELETGSLGTCLATYRCEDCGNKWDVMVIYGDPRWGEEEDGAAFLVRDQLVQLSVFKAINDCWGRRVARAFSWINGDNSRGREDSGLSWELLCRVDPELEVDHPMRFEP